MDSQSLIGTFLAHRTPHDIIATLVGSHTYLWAKNLARRQHRAATIVLVIFLALLKVWGGRLAFPVISPPRYGDGRPTLWQRMAGFFLSSVSIQSGDRLATDVLRWYTTQVVAPRGSRVLSASSQHIVKPREPVDELEMIYGLRSRSKQPAIAAPWDANANPGGITYSPRLRNTWFIHDGRLFFLRLPKTTSSGHHHHSTSLPALPPSEDECLRVICLGWSVAPIQSLLSRCNSFSRTNIPETIKIYMMPGDYGHWGRGYERMSRNIDTVHLDETVKQNLLADMRRYLDPAERRFYYAQGIPYRRGYLFHGPPGTGKTSLSMALAGIFRLPLYLLSLPGVGSDHTLQSLLREVQSRSIVLIEDIDAMAIQRPPGGDGKASRKPHHHQPLTGPSAQSGACTLSGLLNALDGVTSQEGRIVIMTTNHPDRLDSALKRPGRIDREVYLGHMTKAGARAMFVRMLGGIGGGEGQGQGEGDKASSSSSSPRLSAAAAWAETFGELVAGAQFTPAEVQGFLLSHRTAPDVAVEAFRALVAKRCSARASAGLEEGSSEESSEKSGGKKGENDSEIKNGEQSGQDSEKKGEEKGEEKDTEKGEEKGGEKGEEKGEKKGEKKGEEKDTEKGEEKSEEDSWSTTTDTSARSRYIPARTSHAASEKLM